MQGKSVYKAPNGKLLKINLHFAGNKIGSVSIGGDFFLHPEDAIESIEKNLAGKKLNESELLRFINDAVKKNSIQIYGFTPENLVKAIFLARENAEGGK